MARGAVDLKDAVVAAIEKCRRLAEALPCDLAIARARVCARGRGWVRVSVEARCRRCGAIRRWGIVVAAPGRAWVSWSVWAIRPGPPCAQAR